MCWILLKLLLYGVHRQNAKMAEQKVLNTQVNSLLAINYCYLTWSDYSGFEQDSGRRRGLILFDRFTWFWPHFSDSTQSPHIISLWPPQRYPWNILRLDKGRLKYYEWPKCIYLRVSQSYMSYGYCIKTKKNTINTTNVFVPGLLIDIIYKILLTLQSFPLHFY